MFIRRDANHVDHAVVDTRNPSNGQSTKDGGGATQDGKRGLYIAPSIFHIGQRQTDRGGIVSMAGEVPHGAFQVKICQDFAANIEVVEAEFMLFEQGDSDMLLVDGHDADPVEDDL